MKTSGPARTAALLFCFVLGIAFLFTPPAHAVSLSPLTFELNVNPGDTVTNTVTVTNNDSTKQSYVLEAEDFSAVGEQGNVVIDNDAPKQMSAKQWLSFDPKTIEVEPNKSVDVKFTLKVPTDADPGGKYSSILVSSSPGVPGVSGVGLAYKVASLLLIRVSGTVIEKISVQSFDTQPFIEYGPVKFGLRLKNEGTIHLKPAGFIFIKDWRGEEVAKITLPQQRIIPGSIRALDVTWDAKWLFGQYTANFSGIYGSGNEPLTASVSFWVIPWKLLGSILLGLIIIGFIAWKLRRRIALALKILFRGSA